MEFPLLSATKHGLERQAFGMFCKLGDWMHVSQGSTRLFFIYTSFITLVSPLALLALAGSFLMDMSRHMRRRRSVVWDL